MWHVTVMLELGEGAGECVIKDGHVCVCVFCTYSIAHYLLIGFTP